MMSQASEQEAAGDVLGSVAVGTQVEPEIMERIKSTADVVASLRAELSRGGRLGRCAIKSGDDGQIFTH